MRENKNHFILNSRISIFSLFSVMAIMFMLSGCISTPGRYQGQTDPRYSERMNPNRYHSGSVYYMDQISLYRGGSFSIRNVSGQVVFRVRGDLFSRGRRLSITDRNGRQLFHITRNSSRYNSKYRVYNQRRRIAKVYKKSGRNYDRYYINSRNGKDYTVQGNFMNRIYAFYYRGRQVAQMTKRRRSFSENYKIEIDPLHNNIMILIASIIIDMDNIHQRR